MWQITPDLPYVELEYYHNGIERNRASTHPYFRLTLLEYDHDGIESLNSGNA